ncbi:MAG: hypothetical protein K8W52_21030 [Deltaproteobacteria bacterium]|nr:hypothetical protein [Deltaproteobacteria bacterium]
MRIAAAAIAITAPACFVTSTRTGALGAGPELEDHQWFTGWGAMRLGRAAGDECGTAGLASSESGLGIGDLLIDGALAIATGVVGSAVCPLPDRPSTGDATTYAACTSLFSGLGPVLLARKTVRYRCAAR